MVAVAVSALNTRLDDAEVVGTVWNGIGGGAGGALETDFVYQGSNCFARKGASGSRGIYLLDDVTSDLAAGTNKTVMFKYICTTPGLLSSLATPGIRLEVGSATGAYYGYDVQGNDTYPVDKSWLVMPINPNVASHRDNTTGSPDLTAVDYFGMRYDQSAVSKAANQAMDAVDIGRGLLLVSGDGVSADGDWQDFSDHDWGTASNRYGYVRENEGIIIIYGKMNIGSATVTEFSGSKRQIVYPDGLFAAGFSGVFADLQNALSLIYDEATHTSLGTAAGEDTRAVFEWSGASGEGYAAHVLNNFASYIMTSVVVVSGANIETADLTQGGGIIENSTIRCNAASTVAVCNDADFTNLDDVRWIQSGAGHAIEITATGTYSFTNLFFEGFGAIAANDAAIYNNSGGLVTINVSGGDSPTYRNGASASTVVNNTVAWTLAVVDADGVAVQNAEVTVTDNSATPVELFHLENTPVSGLAVYSFDGTDSGNAAIVLVMTSGSDSYEAFDLTTTHPSSATTTTIQLRDDRTEDNPV